MFVDATQVARLFSAAWTMQRFRTAVGNGWVKIVKIDQHTQNMETSRDSQNPTILVPFISELDLIVIYFSDIFQSERGHGEKEEATADRRTAGASGHLRTRSM